MFFLEDDKGGGELTGEVDSIDYELQGSHSFTYDLLASGCDGDTATYATTIDVTWEFDPDVVLEERERVGSSWLPYGGS